MPICLDSCFHMPTCLDLCSLHALYYLPCACALLAIFVCLGLGYVCHVMCYCSLFVDCLSFLCFGLLVWIRSWPYGLGYHQYTLAHIKGFESSYLHVYACLLICFMLVLASLVLGFAMLNALSGFVVVWLRPTPIRPYLDVTIWNALPWCQLPRAHLSLFLLRVMICLPCLFVPPVGSICFTCLLTCPCMSLPC